MDNAFLRSELRALNTTRVSAAVRVYPSLRLTPRGHLSPVHAGSLRPPRDVPTPTILLVDAHEDSRFIYAAALGHHG
ncbi:MAG TPA: hypothetical protein VFY65_07805, partial [Longimicrobium sp.]|nr:hypothetical protein [Longimicrobium sp.]